MCNSTLLSTNGQTSITYCKRCKTHYIWQDSYLLSFDSAHFQRFTRGVYEYKGREKFFNCPDGVTRMMLPTPLPELALTFTFPEWANFILSLEEATYMIEVHELVDSF